MSRGLAKHFKLSQPVINSASQKSVVICPAIAKINWRREFERWGTVEREVKVFSYDQDRTSRRRSAMKSQSLSQTFSFWMAG